jgi:hypothetical protein
MPEPDPPRSVPGGPRTPAPGLVTALDQLDAARERVIDRVSSLADRERALRAPSRGEDDSGWTPVQVVDHLRLVEQLFLEDSRSGKPRWRGPAGFRARFGKVAVALVFRFGVRVRAPTRRVLPGEAPPFPETLSEWHATGAQVREFLLEAGGRAPEAPVLVHPVSGALSPLDTARFLLAHLLHHERQLDRILRTR